MGGWVVEEEEHWNEKFLAFGRWACKIVVKNKTSSQEPKEYTNGSKVSAMEKLHTQALMAKTGNEPKLWTLTHTTYLNMGGLHIQVEDPERPGHETICVVPASQMNPRVDMFDNSYSPLTRLSMSRNEILDKAKGDGFTKSITVTQILWFMTSIIVRKSRDLASSQLEILTLAFAVLAVATYLALWNKPKGIEVPTTIHLGRFSDDIGKAREIMKRIKSNGMRGNSFEAIWDQGVDEATGNNDFRMLLAVMTIFGGLHCLAWNFTFPSTVERYIWRVASIATTSIPVLSLLLLNLDLFLDPRKEKNRRFSYIITIISDMIEVLLLVLSLAMYPLARLALIGVAVSSLRLMPASVYLTTWSKYLPNIQ